jgi:plasmid stability protein
MPAMTIRKLSESAAKNMKAQAKANGRSVEAEARFVLEAQFAPHEKFKSAADVIDEVKRRLGGGIVIPVMQRSKDPIEPADFG